MRSFGLLCDEANDVANKEQLIMFIKFVNQAMGKQNTKFLAPSDLLEKLTSANAATTTWCQKPENNESTPTTEAAII